MWLRKGFAASPSSPLGPCSPFRPLPEKPPPGHFALHATVLSGLWTPTTRAPTHFFPRGQGSATSAHLAWDCRSRRGRGTSGSFRWISPIDESQSHRGTSDVENYDAFAGGPIL